MNDPERVVEAEIVQADDLHRGAPEHENSQQQTTATPHQPRWRFPLALFVATCFSTYLTGGPAFATSLMLILLAHEFGHFLQARRYGVPASLPCFIPMPLSPIGTMGAVIAMQPGKGTRRMVFDIGISGPIAGFFPAVFFSLYGLYQSEIVNMQDVEPGLSLGEPLIFKAMVYWVLGPLPEGWDVVLHPVAYAGWVGIFITALNLFPIGQLDGGHILYCLLRKRSHSVAKLVLVGCIAAVVYYQYWGWVLMLSLLIWMGAVHPKTANDEEELGAIRVFLGWLALLFMPLGFTPVPFILN